MALPERRILRAALVSCLRSGEDRFKLLAHILCSNRRFEPDRFEHIEYVVGSDQIDSLLVQRLGVDMDGTLPLRLMRTVLKTLLLLQPQLLCEVEEQDRVLCVALFIS